MKVLVSDKLGDAGIKLMEEADGIDVDVKTGLSPEELKEIIGEYDALVVRSATKVTDDVLEAATNLKAIGRAGIGVDNIDVESATKRGVIVMNTPTGNIVTTAEHAIAMMMALTRNIPQGTASLKAGRWDKKKLQGREIYNKTLGVIGFGKIGSIVANRARGLRMQVKVYDPVVTPDKIEKAGCKSVSLKELFSSSDYISVHVPKSKKTTGLINKKAFEQMKDGVMLINCARGGIVDEDALYEAMQSGKVAGVALDVFNTEPPPEDYKLLQLDNLIATPHLGASTAEAQTNVAVMVANQIIAYLNTNTVENAVNTPSVSGEDLELLNPFLFLADRMGRLQAQLISGHIKEVKIEYNGNFENMDLKPVSTAFLTGLLDHLSMEDVNTVNAPFLAKEDGIKVSESTSEEAMEYNHLITMEVVSSEMSSMVSGTVFGRNYPRVVKINDFRLEMKPEGYLTLIHNLNIPGEIGSIGTLLGENQVNISKMTVGQEPDGERNIVFLRTDSSLSEELLEQLRDLPMAKSVIYLEL
ncbi:MAG TPA: phosphoglycerate dehydrogenase [Desulfosalsimonadaceae bacterium]|nr:phosphoglycerate dehydrogenase [Desulfosalsimonadaceae bacterium]